MSKQIENQKTTGKRLRAWRKTVPLKLMHLSRLIKVSQGSLSDLENDKSLPRLPLCQIYQTILI